MVKAKALTGTLDVVKDETDGDKVTIDDVVKALNHRGFGPLMMAPALLVILPTGAIPGVPAVAGITLCLVSAQIVFGRHYPWMPKRLKNFSLKRSKLVSAIERARPYTKRIDRYVRPRYKIFAHSLMQRLVATICFVLGIIMTLAGFIPFLPAAIGVPVLLFAVGASAKDGILTLAGFGFTIAATALILWLSGFAGGEDRLHIGEPIFTNISHYTYDLDLLDDWQ